MSLKKPLVIFLTFFAMIVSSASYAWNIQMDGVNDWRATGWSWEVSQSATTHAGGGGGQGRATFGNLVLEGVPDITLVALLKYAAEGRHISRVTLSRGKLTFELEDVLVTQVNMGSDKKGVSVELNFSYYCLSVDGTRGEVEQSCFDIASNSDV